ncbi:MAG: hypothetical protein JF616_06680 [Fibrobacteres bacterium]|nr:hypothetical protein [Fibrobacterota bacterium]
MSRSRFWLVLALSLSACGGSHYGQDDTRIDPDKEKLIDKLTLFVEAVQGDRFDMALGYLTPAEKAKMEEGNGTVSPAMQRRLKAVRLSTLANKPGVQLQGGRLEGIYAWLPNVNHVPGPASSGEVPPPLP